MYHLKKYIELYFIIGKGLSMGVAKEKIEQNLQGKIVTVHTLFLI